MFKDQQQIEEAYRATMSSGSSRSDFAVRYPEFRDTRGWRMEGFGSNAMVVSLQRHDVEKALNDLVSVYKEAIGPGWAGVGSDPVHPLTYEMAQRFLGALPVGMSAPEINADPDGEITFDWNYGRDRILAVSINLSGRLSFIYRNHSTRMRDTLWFMDGQIPDELVGLFHNLKH